MSTAWSNSISAHRLRGRADFAAFAPQIFLVKQAFDHRRAGGGRAESLRGHGLAQFLVLDQLARAFHRAEQRRFREARRGPRFEALRLDRLGLHRFVLPTGTSAGSRRRPLPRAVDRHPAGAQDFSVGPERLALDARDAGRDLELRRREENGEEALRDHVVDLALEVVELLGDSSVGMMAKWSDVFFSSTSFSYYYCYNITGNYVHDLSTASVNGWNWGGACQASYFYPVHPVRLYLKIMFTT